MTAIKYSKFLFDNLVLVVKAQEDALNEELLLHALEMTDEQKLILALNKARVAVAYALIADLRKEFEEI